MSLEGSRKKGRGHRSKREGGEGAEVVVESADVVEQLVDTEGFEIEVEVVERNERARVRRRPEGIGKKTKN